MRLFALPLLCAITLPADVAYQKPPKEILDVLNAPMPPSASLSPARTHMLLIERPAYPTIAMLSAPVHRIAGLRINPANFGAHATTGAYGLVLKEIGTGKETRIAVPPGARLTDFEWSPDGKRFAAANYTATSVELWLGSVDSAALRRVPGVKLNDTLSSSIQWWSGSKELLVRMVPAVLGTAPKPQAAPEGPNTQESLGKSGPVRTYQDMLKSPYDEKLFDYYARAQLAAVDSATLRVTPVGKPGIFGTVSPAPDAKHLLVARVNRPYSYIHPWTSFPRDTEVWDRSGKPVHKVHSAPLQDRIPIEGVPTGPRSIVWRPTEGATLIWLEALDGGDPRAQVPHRDRLMMLRAPFTGPPAEILRTEHRASFPMFGEKGGLAMVSDYDRNRRWVRMFRVFLDDPAAQPKLVFSHNRQDRYKDPGRPIMKTLANGRSVLWQSGDYIFLDGQGATPKGDRPFLDRMDLNTLRTERLFQAGGKGYENVIGLLSDDGSKFLTSYETPDAPPNYCVRTVGSDERKQITSFKDPAPHLRRIRSELVTYKREDGVQLSFTLMLPPDYQPGTRLPAIVWAYPLEYNDGDTAGQISGSTERYVQMRGADVRFLLLSGYALLYNATIPIIGDPETVNNTYVEQLTMGAKAAIQKAAEMGVIDPNRVGVTGHSYGGFMTANLLAHTDLFRAGVARSGAYNRTLTPFGFQSERRTYWQARDIYMKMSPFNYAEKINEPLLLLHGEADNNQGTFPIQSERMYHAVRGNGGVVRLTFLPFESHGYAGKESIEHALWEMVTWFDRYVKNAPPQTSHR
jgi:dipeptidyl aminopeptidase/acylaminoacyl peptidase